MKPRFISVKSTLVRALAVLALMVSAIPAQSAALVDSTIEPYGTFKGVDYVRHTGWFVGSTAKGNYRVPFEIVAPADSFRANRTVLFEAPHFIYGPAGRNLLGAELLFEKRFSYATVGFSNEGLNLLNPAAPGAMIADMPALPLAPPVPPTTPILRDVEILKQFAEALVADPTAIAALGRIERRYAYGVSQSAEALYELFYGPGATGIFDLTLLHVPLWRPAFARPEVLAVLPDEFLPLSNIGKVMIVSAEGDLLISESIELRNALSDRNYRVYEVAGAPHLALDMSFGDVRSNPLDVAPVVRAAFVAGDRWGRGYHRPPRSRILESAPAGSIDPVYTFPTGIARDENLNAAGGIRFPDVKTGRAFHVATEFRIEVIEGLPGLVGVWFPLECGEFPGIGNGEPVFRDHRDYVHQVIRQAFSLLWRGYILADDAGTLIRDAVNSDVGKPGSCPGAP